MAKDGPDGWDYLWREFAQLTEGYLWWGSPQIDAALIPSAQNTQKPLLADNIQSGIVTPYSTLPKNEPGKAKDTLIAMLEEMKAMPGRYYSVSALEVNEASYEDAYLGIQSIQSKLHETIGSEYDAPYHYSTQQYGDTIRILWINQFNEDKFEEIESVYSDEELWKNYISGIEGYLWWASQEIDDRQKPRANLLQKVDMIFRII